MTDPSQKVVMASPRGIIQRGHRRRAPRRLSPVAFAALAASASLYDATIIGVDALFIRPSSKLVSYPSLRLGTADTLRVPYEGVAYDASDSASFPTFALSLDAEFGPLDCVTFLGLQEAYCSWSETKSRVKWREGESYTLLDFLPPLLQAVSGLYFRSSRVVQPGLPSFVGGPDDDVEEMTEQEVLLTSNCWGFAWEVLFQADNADVRAMTISTADPTSAWREFTGPGFYLVQTSLNSPKLLTDPVLRNRRIRGGDVLLIWHQIPGGGQNVYLDHVATVLDDDVYYEKSGSGDATPFRISTWDMITANFPPGVFIWEWRRLVRNRTVTNGVKGRRRGGRRLKSASDAFGLDAQVTKRDLGERFNLLRDLRPSVAKKLSLTPVCNEGCVEGHAYTGIQMLEDIVFDEETGRASLPPSAFVELKRPKLPSNPYWGVRRYE